MAARTATRTSISERLKKQVTAAIRSRGERYFKSNQVEACGGDERFVHAGVWGSHLYDVNLEYDREVFTLFGACTCPYFDENFDICKHIWAVLLEAETRGLLSACRDEVTRLEPYDVEDSDAWDPWGEDDDWDDQDEPFAEEGRGLARRRTGEASPPAAVRRRGVTGWRQLLADMDTQARKAAVRIDVSGRRVEPWPADRQVVYVIDAAATLQQECGLLLETGFRERKKDGDWGKPRSRSFDHDLVATLPDETDRQIIGMVLGAKSFATYSYYRGYETGSSRFELPVDSQCGMVRSMCETGRCLLRAPADPKNTTPLTWDDGEPWSFVLRVRRESGPDRYVLGGELRRGGQTVPLSDPVIHSGGGLVFFNDHVARLDHHGAFGWIPILRRAGLVEVQTEDAEALMEWLLTAPVLPPLDLPEELRFELVEVRPTPRLHLRSPEQSKRATGWNRLAGEVSFDYAGRIVPADDGRRGLFDAETRQLIPRDDDTEAHAVGALFELGFKEPTWQEQQMLDAPALMLAAGKLSAAVRELTGRGWHVEADGKVFRTGGAFNVRVDSGIDWFELHGEMDFDGQTASLPELLKAAKRGDNTVTLGDGTVGVLPDDWVGRFGGLIGLGKTQDDHVRFKPTQTALLDALLAAMPEARCDAVFEQARDRLRKFDGVAPATPPDSFHGELRDYQREGLGWLDFLRDFGFGGCLADDMGLGKTVQVLAMLDARRRARSKTNGKGNGKRNGKASGDSSPTPTDARKPALAVVPRSLLWNWKQEAARFTPDLKVLIHAGLDRVKQTDHLHDYDLVLTTYGTLRRDITYLKDASFDYAILDEAQAIKNANTAGAKAARLLDADHRLAMTGTPVENHLGELWSIFEFLNPGMLGTAKVFQKLAGSTNGKSKSNGNGNGNGEGHGDDPGRAVLGQALRPFILRRTKQQVASDLPEKLEQTLHCDLRGKQRKQYDELRDHYRKALLKKVDETGLKKSKIQVLEALLRLRQAACHPGLIDKKRRGDASAKLDALVPQLIEVIEEGHKALVFSQFTTFLSIVRDRLDEQGVAYEYLDGRTRKRGPKVERFQNDPDCKLFLISLKAGGVGLNLTAADYVFLLDPWWNPAVESQAIDRTHRIGQTRRVFAYRLIARDTVEEKVVQLQQSKRELADAIINADNSLIRELSRDDLELLLS